MYRNALWIVIALSACENRTATSEPLPEKPPRYAAPRLLETLGPIEAVAEVLPSESIVVDIGRGRRDGLFMGARFSGNGRMIAYVPPLKNAKEKYQVWARDLTDDSKAPILVSSLDGTTATAADNHMGHPNIDVEGRYVVFAGYASNLGAGSGLRNVFLKDLRNPALPPVVLSKAPGQALPGANCHSIHLAPGGTRLFMLCQSGQFPGQIAARPLYMLYQVDLDASNLVLRRLSVPGYAEEEGWQLVPANASFHGDRLLIEATRFGRNAAPRRTIIVSPDTGAVETLNNVWPARFVCQSAWMSPDASYVLAACLANANGAGYQILRYETATKKVTEPFADLTVSRNITHVGNRFFADSEKSWSAGTFRRDGIIDLLYLQYSLETVDVNGKAVTKNGYFYLNSPSGRDLGNVDERCDWMEPALGLTRFVFSCQNIATGKRTLYRRGNFGDQ